MGQVVELMNKEGNPTNQLLANVVGEIRTLLEIFPRIFLALCSFQFICTVCYRLEIHLTLARKLVQFSSLIL